MVSLEGYGEKMATFVADDSVKKGVPVTVSGNGTVTAAAAGNNFCGIAHSVRNGCAAVQLAGFVRIGYTDTVPSYGYQSFVADGSGGIKNGSGGFTALVVELDTANAVCGLIL